MNIISKKALSHYILAVKYILDAIRIHKTSLTANLMMAHIYNLNEMLLESINVYEELIKIYPNQFMLYFLASSNYGRLENRIKQIELLNTAIIVSPNRISAHLELARAYAIINERGQAEKKCHQVSKLNPDLGKNCYQELPWYNNQNIARGWRYMSREEVVYAEGSWLLNWE
jgi:tetratricopeptide (TPR) repeat protein